MMDFDLFIEVRQARGILLDTNVLLLAVIGTLGQNAVARFERTKNQFDQSDYETLKKILNQGRPVWTTPHILTETSNFLGQTGNQKALARQRLLELVSVYEECWEKSTTVLEDHAFLRFGLTDSAIGRAARQLDLVLISTDGDLCQELQRRSIRAVNFHHFRNLTS